MEMYDTEFGSLTFQHNATGPHASKGFFMPELSD
jgi:hypothetical protein